MEPRHRSDTQYEFFLIDFDGVSHLFRGLKRKDTRVHPAVTKPGEIETVAGVTPQTSLEIGFGTCPEIRSINGDHHVARSQSGFVGRAARVDLRDGDAAVIAYANEMEPRAFLQIAHRAFRESLRLYHFISEELDTRRPVFDLCKPYQRPYDQSNMHTRDHDQCAEGDVSTDEGLQLRATQLRGNCI